MSKIIETLRAQNYNILSTDNENIFHFPVGSGHNLVVDTDAKPDTWTLEKDGEHVTAPPLESVIEAEKFIKVYNLEKLEINEEIFDAPPQKWKEGGAKALAKKQHVQRMPAVIPSNMRDIQIQELSIEDIKNYICPTATDQEAFMFLKLCQARQLNPFLNEAYLIKYGDKTTMTVGKEAFMRRAEAHPQFDGYEAGIIIQHQDKTLERREGTFILKNEDLVGGWAKVYRKDRKQPFVSEVAFHEYNTGKALWASKPATMIRKVAIVQGKREAFPSEFSGMYDSSEMGVENPEIIDASYQEVQQEAL